jgi:hypothetical protein
VLRNKHLPPASARLADLGRDRDDNVPSVLRGDGGSPLTSLLVSPTRGEFSCCRSDAGVAAFNVIVDQMPAIIPTCRHVSHRRNRRWPSPVQQRLVNARMRQGCQKLLGLGCLGRTNLEPGPDDARCLTHVNAGQKLLKEASGRGSAPLFSCGSTVP